MIIKNKKGVELTLQEMIKYIIFAIVLVVVIFFAIKYLGGGGNEIRDVGSGFIDAAKNSS